MYIKEIKLNGFKSFALKTNIELNKTFTGIVGPNGSGKSNVVDAIKWVLGEQSIKSLRGENNMTDVIFSGSSSRTASNSASVSIIFDNSDKALPVDFSEVEIKRVVYRTGENEYYINSDKCRLKDITNLLLDSMSSKESLNIIPQKKVDEILSEKPEDRRGIFEDAAGVLKYKTRKTECLRKLDKTHDNMSRVDMIINEISENLIPLERASIKAREYKDSLSELENVEVALIVKDVTTFSALVTEKTNKKEVLEDELSKLNTDSTSDNIEVEKIKTKIFNIDEDIRNTSSKLFSLSEELVELSNKKTLMSERNKYDKESNAIKNNIIELKDKEGILNNNTNSLKLEMDNMNTTKNTLNNKLSNISNDLNKLEISRNSLNDKFNSKNRLKIDIKNRIDILQNSINNMSKIPYSVKVILDNPTLRGIHDIVSNVIETKSEYSTMLEISLGATASTIITEDETCAKEAIEYLKSHNKGRATFFPLNVIKPKSVDPNTLRNIKDIVGFVGIASDLVTYDSKYYNIVMNTLGNIIVSTNITSAIQISKKINHQYRVVSLDGEIIHVGGSLTGGSQNKNNSYISDKYELDKLIINSKSLDEELDTISNDLKKYDEEIISIKDNIYNINVESIKLNETINNKKVSMDLNIQELSKLKDEIKNLSSNDESALSKELNEIIDKYYKKENEKTELEKKMEILNKSKLDLNKDLIILETSIKKMNNSNTELINNINSLDIDITKLNAALDNLLNRLNEDYSMTYERAKSTYLLEIDEDEARDKVSTLRRKIKSLGDVNLGSIEEYNRLSVRVNFLNKQKDDLKKSEDDLLSIINDMDGIMKEKFESSFNDINVEFNKVFKELFHGGEAHLKLTDPQNILETGIEIIAVPSGKSLKPISLLSGGERTLTAISLLFAIMNLKNVPFVVLDEVESDLDDNNVSIFCDYLNNYRNKTQLLIITHKKKTMEYLDVLYGVTMQESGVSKLVSVKLED